MVVSTVVNDSSVVIFVVVGSTVVDSTVVVVSLVVIDSIVVVKVLVASVKDRAAERTLTRKIVNCSTIVALKDAYTYYHIKFSFLNVPMLVCR